MSKRNPYEQQEFQRKNPHLFTTLDQCVNLDGSITTFADVTKSLRYTLDNLNEGHIAKFGGPHPVYCMRAIIGGTEEPICQMTEYTKGEMDKVRTTFVRNYRYSQPPTNPSAEHSKGEV